MTNITEFNSIPCPQIDPLQISAYFTLSLDEVNNNLLKLDTSWGCTEVDLSPVVKNSETVTTLFITPEGSLQFNREDYGKEGTPDGGVDCITGKELSQIVSMQYLKDVSQNTAIGAGDVYMYDGDSGLFQPYDLQNFVTSTAQTLESHGASITQLTGSLQAMQNSMGLLSGRVSALETRMAKAESNIAILQSQVATLQTQMASVLARLSSIESQIARPVGVPTNTRLVYGNINYLSDYTNSQSTSTGLYSHNPNTKAINDAYDA